MKTAPGRCLRTEPEGLATPYPLKALEQLKMIVPEIAQIRTGI